MSKKEWQALPVDRVLRNIGDVFRTGDSSKMMKCSYDVINQMGGFIAHYDINGFRHEYSDVRSLSRDLLSSMDTQDPERYVRDQWFQDQYGLAYCQSKTDVYKGLKVLAEKYG